MRALLRAVVIFAVLSVAVTASADVFYDTYQRGLDAFKAHDYPTARAEFLRAYDLRAEPIVLFNIAQTYRLEDNATQALDYYNRFLAGSKIAEDLRTEAQGYVDELEAEQAAQAEQDRLAAEAGPKEDDGTAVTMKTPPMDRAGGPREDDGASEAPIRKRRVPLGSWIAASVGGVGLVSSIVLGVLGHDAEQALHDDPMPTQADADRVDRYETAINVSWALTGVAVVTGVVLYFVAPAYRNVGGSVAIGRAGDGGWSAAWTAQF